MPDFSSGWAAQMAPQPTPFVPVLVEFVGVGNQWRWLEIGTAGCAGDTISHWSRE